MLNLLSNFFQTVMANCARLVSSDHFSSNGVVHMVDRVIQPARHTIGRLGRV